MAEAGKEEIEERVAEIRGNAVETLTKACDDIRLGHYEDAIGHMGAAFGLVLSIEVLKREAGGKKVKQCR